MVASIEGTPRSIVGIVPLSGWKPGVVRPPRDAERISGAGWHMPRGSTVGVVTGDCGSSKCRHGRTPRQQRSTARHMVVVVALGGACVLLPGAGHAGAGVAASRTDRARQAGRRHRRRRLTYETATAWKGCASRKTLILRRQLRLGASSAARPAGRAPRALSGRSTSPSSRRAPDPRRRHCVSLRRPPWAPRPATGHRHRSGHRASGGRAPRANRWTRAGGDSGCIAYHL